MSVQEEREGGTRDSGLGKGGTKVNLFSSFNWLISRVHVPCLVDTRYVCTWGCSGGLEKLQVRVHRRSSVPDPPHVRVAG